MSAQQHCAAFRRSVGDEIRPDTVHMSSGQIIIPYLENGPANQFD